MSVLPAEGVRFDTAIPLAIIGAGACGLVAALAAHDRGVEPVVFERDARPAGSTALSSGFIPAAGTRLQRAKGIADSPELLAEDVRRKTHGLADPTVLETVARASGPAIDWLADRHGLEFVLVEGFLYPSHSVLRMHAHPRKTGEALMGALLGAAERAGITIVTSARVVALYADPRGHVRGIEIERPDGGRERIGCDALVLASNGFGGNAEMVGRYIPEMAKAIYFGHTGNQGDAARWGEALGGELRHMGAYQGHGSVAHPHGILITWALMMSGGIQVNSVGLRFSNEHLGYSEQAVAVLDQPDGIVWDLYDARLHELGMEFEDYREAQAAGAVRCCEDLAALAATTGLPKENLTATLAEMGRCHLGQADDAFGRDFTKTPPLTPPYYAIRVTGTLFHTQGGLAVDAEARVLRRDGTALPNLFAGGGAACGASGPEAWGYFSGNGLLSAVALGRIAGDSAASFLLASGTVPQSISL